jgi:putative ABC transport system permease protein
MEIRALLSAMGRSKTGPALVAAQIALTLAVLVNVTYMIQQRLADAGRPTGLDLANTFWVDARTTAPADNHAAQVKADLAYFSSLPGVVAASIISTVPQTMSESDLTFSADPAVVQRPGGGEVALIYTGSEGLIDALGLKLIAGRNFSPGAVQPPLQDGTATMAHWAPEMIITQALADKLFPGGRALGKTVHAGFINKPAVVVGIVGLMRANPFPLQDDSYAIQDVLVPIIPSGPNVRYVIRAAPGRRDAIMARVEKEFADLQPGRFINRMEALEHTAERSRSGYRASVIILGVAAFFVLLVTVVGIVGLAAYNVASRTKQLGTRRALGATKFHILRYFLVENWITTTSGVVLGCVLGLAAGIEVSRQFQTPRLPLYYLAGGVLLMWLVGLLAVLLPARRAASIPPATATRTV